MNIINIVNNLCSIEIKIIPVLGVYLLCLLPTKIREQFNFMYSPIYCSLPVFKNSRRLQDFFMGKIPDNGEGLRKVKKSCLLSYAIDTTIVPIILGIIFGLFNMPKDVLYPGLICIILKRATQFIKCFIEIKKENILNAKDKFRLIVFYTAFIISFIYYINKAHTLISTNISLSIFYYLEEVAKLLFNYFIAWIGIPTDIMSVSEPFNELELVDNEVSDE